MGHPNDIRVVLSTTVIYAFTDGSQTFLSRALEAH
jgi:hypothetical protein